MIDKGKLYTLALGILLSVGMIGFGMFLGYRFADDGKMIEKTTDTIYIERTDTIRFASEVDFTHKTEKVVETRYVEVHDTIVKDSIVFMPIEITQKHYHKDSICDIWVSGYEPCLDSANIIQKERIIIEKHYLPVSEYKNSIGVIGGINNCALMYQRNIGRRFQVGGYVGSDYSGKTQAGINAGFRF